MIVIAKTSKLSLSVWNWIFKLCRIRSQKDINVFIIFSSDFRGYVSLTSSKMLAS